MAHETLTINRHEKFDPSEGEIVIHFKYHAGSPGTYMDPPEPDEIEILKIEAGDKDITDLISEEEYEYIENYLYDNWRTDVSDDEADYRYERCKEERDRE